jgi:hypothetical protein
MSQWLGRGDWAECAGRLRHEERRLRALRADLAGMEAPEVPSPRPWWRWWGAAREREAAAQARRHEARRRALEAQVRDQEALVAGLEAELARQEAAQARPSALLEESPLTLSSHVEAQARRHAALPAQEAARRAPATDPWEGERAPHMIIKRRP